MPRTAFLKQGAKRSRRHQAAGGTVAPVRVVNAFLKDYLAGASDPSAAVAP